MVGKLGQMGIDRAAVDLLERLADGAVAVHARRGRHPVQQRLADQPVAEAVLAEGRRGCHDDAERRRLVERGEHAVAVLRRGALERREVKCAPDDRGQLEHLDRAGGERLQAPADRLAHALGQRQLVGRVEQPSLGEQQREDLAREERVALRDGMHGARQPRRRADAARQLDELRDVLAREAAEHEPAPGADDVLQRELRVRRAVGHALVHRDDEQHGDVAQHPRHEVQRHERALVDVLQIVHEDDDGPARAARAQQRHERIEEREASDLRVLSVARRRLRGRQALGELRGQPQELVGGRAELPAQRRAVEVLREAADDLDPRPVRGRGATPSPRPDDARPEARRMLGERGRQPRLADAGIAEHELHAAVAAAGVPERVVQLAQLPYTTDERAFTRRWHSRKQLLVRQSLSSS